MDNFFIEAYNVHGYIYDYSEVIFNIRKDKIKIICNVEGHEPFFQTVDNHLQGQGCPTCAAIQRGLNRRIPENDFFMDCKFLHENYYDYSKTSYNGMYNDIKPICPKHGEFTVLATKHYHRKQGCPICSDEQLKSKPVLEIESFLKEKSISYVMEKKFDNCKNKLVLPFDFYIPEYNLLIEYDGIQHYKPIDFFGGEDALIAQQLNDSIKTQYCHDNNINLLRIKYDEDHISVLIKYFYFFETNGKLVL